MTIEKTLVIPSKGHLLHEESIIMSACEAYKSVQQDNKYTVAKRDPRADGICLIRHWYKCAHCFQAFPASIFSKSHSTENDEVDECISDLAVADSEQPQPEQDFHDWALQLTFPDLEMREDDFIFFQLPDRDQSLACPHCGYSTHTTTRSFKYWVHSDPQLTTVTQTIAYNDKGVALPYGKQMLSFKSFPLTVKIVFDHKNRQSFYKLEDKHNHVVEQISLDQKRGLLTGYAIQACINSDSPLNSALSEAFGKFYNGEIPFTPKELTLDTFAILNRFQGFPKKFYDAIPFVGIRLLIDKSFAETIVGLDQYDNVPEMYKKYGLPNKKAIKKAVFENPALLFYANEMAALPFRNLDVFLQIICSERVFDLLAKLHSLPGIVDYITALCAAKGETGAWMVIKKQIDYISDAAALFLLSAPKDRKEMLKHKIKKYGQDFCEIANPHYNLPINTKNKLNIADCTIAGYDFCRLKNTYEYHKAGRELHNCLFKYRPRDGHVVCVKTRDTFIAAIEIVNDEIVQACLNGNMPIETDKKLFPVFIEWVLAKGLMYSDPDIDIPF